MTTGPQGISHLFVYGTLQPGDVRWHFLEPFVVDTGVSDTAGGSVYDTGLGYPAAVFDHSTTIHGRTYELNVTLLDRCLAVLDEEEGTVGGAYERVSVVTGNGVRAWAYAYGGGLELRLIPSGDWSRR